MPRTLRVLRAPSQAFALALATALLWGGVALATQQILPVSNTQMPRADRSTAVIEGVASAEIVWIRQFSAPIAEGVAVDAEGDAYVVGNLAGVVSWLDLCQPLWSYEDGRHHAFLRKYDTNGSELWTRCLGTSMSNTTSAAAVAVGSSGVYVAGSTYGSFPGLENAGGLDAYVSWYDAGGNGGRTWQFGGPEDDAAYAIDVDTTGIYVAGGTFSRLGTIPGAEGAGLEDAFVARFFQGNLVWTHQYGTSSNERAEAVAVDSSGVYVTGGAFVRKLDFDGREVWTRMLGCRGVGRACHGIATDDTGIYVVGGDVDAHLQKYDANGEVIWGRVFGTSESDIALAVSVDSEGVYTAGSTEGAFPDQVNAGSFDAFVRRYGREGEEGWTVQFGSSQSDVVLDLDVRSSAVYAAGWTAGTLPGQTRTGGPDGFVAKLEVAVNEPPAVTEPMASPAQAVPRQEIIFAATASDSDGYIAAWTWNFGDGLVGHFDAVPGLRTITITVTHGYVAPGTYTVTLAVEDDGGGVTAKFTTVRVVASLSLEISADPITGMAPLAVSFSASPSGGVPTYSFNWDFGEGNSSTSQSPSHTYLVARTYTIKLDVTDADGHTVNGTIQITVESPTTPVRPEAMPTWVLYVGAVAIAIGIGGALLLRYRRRLRVLPSPPSE